MKERFGFGRNRRIGFGRREISDQTLDSVVWYGVYIASGKGEIDGNHDDRQAR